MVLIMEGYNTTNNIDCNMLNCFICKHLGEENCTNNQIREEFFNKLENPHYQPSKN
jgi:hypothetical protein